MLSCITIDDAELARKKDQSKFLNSPFSPLFHFFTTDMIISTKQRVIKREVGEFFGHIVQRNAYSKRLMMIESKIEASICYLFSFHWLSQISFRLEVNRRWSYTNRVDVTLPAQSNRVWAEVLGSAYVNASPASTRRRHVVREREASVTKTTAHRASIQPWPLNFQLGNFLSDGDFKASNTPSINVSLIKV